MSAAKTMQVDIVNLEQEIFSGAVEQLIVKGASGELGILPGHTSLLTFLKPGEVRLCHADVEEFFYISGGTLEVQPNTVTILADTVIRAKDLDEFSALQAKERAEQILKANKSDSHYSAAAAELAKALAKLRTIHRLRNKR